MEDITGKELGAYRVVGPLGEGGMAAVYRCYHPATERYVALKVLARHLALEPDFLARFRREARVLAQLQHPHILQVFDFGDADDYTYLVMPLVKGGTLASLARGRSVPLPRIRQIISQIGDALHHAHVRGLIHRDLKPANILIDDEGNCLLADFGLARILDTTEEEPRLTRTGVIMGTPAYMSPEQGAGLTLDARTDIYSLGIVLFELATGRVPFRAETPLAIIVKHINDPLPMPRTLNPALSESLERVIIKALAKDPNDRYQTAGDFVRAIRAAIAETEDEATEGDSTVTLGPEERPPGSRLRLGFLVAGAVLASLLAAKLALRVGHPTARALRAPAPTAPAPTAAADTRALERTTGPPVEAASRSASAPPPEPTAHHDGVPRGTVAESTTVWHSPRSGLSWSRQDNGADIAWRAAERYCSDLVLGDRSDWRLPTVRELSALYDPKRPRSRTGAATRVTEPFRMTGLWAWSSNRSSPTSAWVFVFTNGLRYSFPLATSHDGRVLCVRR